MITYEGRMYVRAAEILSRFPMSRPAVYRWIKEERIDVLDIDKFCKLVLCDRIPASELRGELYIDLLSFEKAVGLERECDTDEYDGEERSE